MSKNKIYLIILFFILFFGDLSLADNNEKTKIYQPYPIVFVSGIGTNPDSDAKDYPANGTWKYILSRYSKYFFIESKEESKYIHVFDKSKVFDKELPYLEFLVYDGSQQAITLSADQLKDKIDNVLTRYYTDEYNYSYPCNKKKVILVCHSMGGLIAREAIRKYPNLKDKIEYITFIGTPHMGSPLANIAYFIALEKNKLDDFIWNYEKILSTQDGFQREKNKYLLAQAKNKNMGDLRFMIWAKRELNIECVGDAIKDMRLPFSNANSYNHILTYEFMYPVLVNGHYETKKFKMSYDEKIPSYDEKETFIYKLNQYGLNQIQPVSLGIPNEKIFTIAGTNMNLKWGIYGELYFYLTRYFNENDFNCLTNDYYNDGDGTVPLSSEKYYANSTPNNFVEIDRCHTTIYIPVVRLFMAGEYDFDETPYYILNKIDPNPIISSIKVVPKNREDNSGPLDVYIISKVNEYLLADMDISAMTINGVDIRPNNFLTSEFVEIFPNKNPIELNMYKPYVDSNAKSKKDFLITRPFEGIKDKDGKDVILEPGEFYVPTTLGNDTVHSLILKVRNPAWKEVAAFIKIQRPVIDNIYPLDNIDDKQPTITARISNASTELYEEIDQAKDGIVKLKGDGTPSIKTRSVDLDLTSISMTLSGPNTEGEVNIEPILNFSSLQDITLAYTPTSDLTPGKYTVTVNGSDMWGLPAQEKTWTFEIPGEHPPIICEEQPTNEVNTQTPIISARAYSPDGIDIDLNSISMSVDGYGGGFSVSPSTGGSDITITHNSEKLDYGSHNVNLSLRDKAGQSASKSWSFTIKNPNAFFEVSLPGTISRDTDFTMTVTAKNPDGTPLNTYNEPAAITISGDPNPTGPPAGEAGEIFIKRINSNEWQDGTWTTNLQRYLNGNESKYKLTITVEGLGSTYPNIKGSADTLVEPLYLTCENIGFYNINTDTGLWESPQLDEAHGQSVNTIECKAGYIYFRKFDGGSQAWDVLEEKYSGIANIYKIEIPENSDINKIILNLNTKPLTLTFPPEDFHNNTLSASTLYRKASFRKIAQSQYPPYPKDRMAYFRLDMNHTNVFNGSSPGGDDNLYTYNVGGLNNKRTGDSSNEWNSFSYSFAINWLDFSNFELCIDLDANTKAIYLTLYPDNFLELSESYYDDIQDTIADLCELDLKVEMSIGLVAGIK